MKKTIRKLMCICLSALLALSVSLGAGAAGYADVPAGSWYEKAVSHVTEAGLFSGYTDGKFHPQDKMNRAMLVTVLANATDGYNADEYTLEKVGYFYSSLPYTDIDEQRTTWYNPAVRWATVYGIAKGKGEKFAPFDSVTREEAAVMLYRYAENTKNDVTHKGSSLSGFTDRSAVSSWAVDALDWAVEKGLLQGYPDNSLKPKNTLTRAEAAEIFMRADSVLTKRRTYSPMSDTAKKYGVTLENFPKIDGSTSTLDIVWAITRAMYGEGTPEFESAYELEASKTVPSYYKLINGEVDMIVVPSCSDEVLADARAAGVELEFHKIAEEALVFFTHEQNGTENVTREQVRDIYLNYGIKNWSELGGPNLELVPVCRNSDSGSQGLLDDMILDYRPMHPDIEENYIALTMDGILYQVASYYEGHHEPEFDNRYALGYTLYSYMHSMGEFSPDSDVLKMLSYNGVEPTVESISDGSYALSDGYYCVVRKDLSQDSGARGIIRWLQSDAGKAELDALGYISAAGKK